MDTAVLVAQIVIALGIVNVWIFRFGQSTSWRGSTASNMTEEFRAYGLPVWSMYGIGALKLLAAVLLVVGIWVPEVTQPAAMGLGVLMLGAVSMHVRVKDPLRKSLPAFTMLVLCAFVAFA